MNLPAELVWRYSAFADEAADTLEGQMLALAEAGISRLDVRTVAGKNVVDMSPADLSTLGETCAKNRIQIESIATPVNKVPLQMAHRDEEMGKLERGIEAARRLRARTVRIFSPEPPPDRVAALPEVMSWMRPMADMAAKAEVMVVHENDGKFAGAYPDVSARMMEELGSPTFRFAFDFANTVLLGFRPLPDWFPWSLPYLETIHMKDAISATGQIVPVGQGDGQVARTLELLVQNNWVGALSLEPHLEAAGPFGGFSGLRRFQEASAAVRAIVRSVGADLS